MKKICNILLAVLLVALFSTGSAASWVGGRSPSQPYPGVPSVNLNQTMGYMVFYPNAKMPADNFCDTLLVYFPREDIIPGQGFVYVFENGKEILKLDVTDEDILTTRSMTEAELDGLLWGSGMAAQIHLPISLQFNQNYYVVVEQGAIGTVRSVVVNPPVPEKKWTFKLEGEYGVGGLHYVGPKFTDRDGVEHEEELRNWPRVGDEIHFTIKLGGEAVKATIYDPSGAISVPGLVYTRTTDVIGSLTENVGEWGVIFQDANDQIIKVVDLNPISEEGLDVTGVQ